MTIERGGAMGAAGSRISTLLGSLEITLPILQAPMAGVSTPAMAAEVSKAGGLGGIAAGAGGVAAAREAIGEFRAREGGALNVNVFAHRPAIADRVREAAWIERLRPRFAAYGVAPPSTLAEIYTSFVVDDAMLAALVELRPSVVSLHFGLPDAARIAALREAGIVLLASVTSPEEAQAAVAAGIDVLVAQGFEAGGHRGCFDPDAPDGALSTEALVRALAGSVDRPVVAAGGIMDGDGIAAALGWGAAAAQLGTAYVATDESLADAGYRAALAAAGTNATVMTRAISGRPARCLANRFTAFGTEAGERAAPDYPIAYDLGKRLHAAAKARGEFGWGAQWAGTGVPAVRRMGAGALTRVLAQELRAAST